MTKNQLMTELKDIKRRLYDLLNVLDGQEEGDLIDDALELLETTEKSLHTKPYRVVKPSSLG